MTINIALVTSEAIVLGCDSLSSVVEPVFRLGDIEPLRGNDGEPVLDAIGRPYFAGGISQVVTGVFGGVTKMFGLCEKDDSFQVAAVAAGLAIIEGMTIAEQAHLFRKETNKLELADLTVEVVAQKFLEYLRIKWEATVNYPKPEEIEGFTEEQKRQHFDQFISSNIEVLVAGFDSNTEAAVYRLDIFNNQKYRQIKGISEGGDGSGIAWAGQANFVQRLLMGTDSEFQFRLGQKGVTGDALNELVLPSYTKVDFANLPVQYAVDFVEMLVNVQSGMQRFEPGIATVGGRTHIGVLRRGEKFSKLNEPELVHKHTGYSHDD